MQGLGKVNRCTVVFGRPIERTTMDTPNDTFDILALVFGAFWRANTVVEPDEIEGRSNPGCTGDDVEPPGE